MENPHNRNDGLKSDYCDGEQFRHHPLFSTDPCALQLLLYFDELEVCNPLGSRANKHKLGNFKLYFSYGMGIYAQGVLWQGSLSSAEA